MNRFDCISNSILPSFVLKLLGILGAGLRNRKYVKNLKNLKYLTESIQQSDISTKNLKENSEVSTRYSHESINLCIENLIFSSDLRVANVTPAFKKKSKITIDPIAFYLIYLKYMKDVFTTKFRLTLIKSYLNINVDFAKDLKHNTA